jgi:HAD superfamily hydrolase (TIGR01509 family)
MYSYIFDFDGVLARTMEAHFICYEKALAEVGVPLIKERFFSQAGMTAIEQIRCFCELAGVNADYAAIYARKKEIYKEMNHRAEPIECNIELLRALKKLGFKVAIATGGSVQSVGPVVEQLGLEIDAFVTAEDVKRGKPNPDLFLAAAERLGVNPNYCIVIEDSDAGIEAAYAAGMNAMRFYEAAEV